MRTTYIHSVISKIRAFDDARYYFRDGATVRLMTEEEKKAIETAVEHDFGGVAHIEGRREMTQEETDLLVLKKPLRRRGYINRPRLADILVTGHRRAFHHVFA